METTLNPSPKSSRSDWYHTQQRVRNTFEHLAKNLQRIPTTAEVAAHSQLHRNTVRRHLAEMRYCAEAMGETHSQLLVVRMLYDKLALQALEGDFRAQRQLMSFLSNPRYAALLHQQTAQWFGQSVPSPVLTEPEIEHELPPAPEPAPKPDFNHSIVSDSAHTAAALSPENRPPQSIQREIVQTSALFTEQRQAQSPPHMNRHQRRAVQRQARKWAQQNTKQTDTTVRAPALG